jgi:hypothetical protein
MKTKLLLTVSLLSIALSLSGVVMAYAKQPPATDTPLVDVYENPKSNKVIQRVSPAVSLIPIFKQQDWVKVGNPNTGDIGWVNLAQWQQANLAFYTPDIQSIYVYTQQSKAGAKPATNIVAYKNGEKLTDRQAKQLYEQVKKQQHTQQQALIALQRSMQKSFDQSKLLHDIFWQHELQQLMLHPNMGFNLPLDLLPEQQTDS